MVQKGPRCDPDIFRKTATEPPNFAQLRQRPEPFLFVVQKQHPLAQLQLGASFIVFLHVGQLDLHADELAALGSPRSSSQSA